MLLAIDTATNLAGIALMDESTLRGAHQWQTGRNHTVELMPNVMRLLSEAGARPEQLDAVAVAIGPGSYTGLRIGLSVAKGFCLAHGAALLGVPTLDISAEGSALRGGLLCAILQAGRGRLAAGFYRAHEGRWRRSGELFYGRAPELAEACGGQKGSGLLHQRVDDLRPSTAGQKDSGPLSDTSIGAGHPRVDDLMPSPAGEDVYFAGELDADTVAVLRARLAERAAFAPEGERARDPRVLARLGWERLRQGLQDNLETLAPAYGQ